MQRLIKNQFSSGSLHHSIYIYVNYQIEIRACPQ
jgi:hypothetical protein